VVLIAVGSQAIGALSLTALSFLSVKSGVLAAFGGVARSTGPWTFAALFVVAAIAPGFAEELIFRGLLQSRLVERWGALAGIAISSLLFGLWHFDVRQGLMAMTMGAWLGWCAHRQKTIVNVAFGHALNNGFALVLSRLVAPDDSGASAPTLLAIAAAAVLSGALVWRRTKGLAT
jgi:membrane protease YdiL (CAAX protease family)